MSDFLLQLVCAPESTLRRDRRLGELRSRCRPRAPASRRARPNSWDKSPLSFDSGSLPRTRRVPVSPPLPLSTLSPQGSHSRPSRLRTRLYTAAPECSWVTSRQVSGVLTDLGLIVDRRWDLFLGSCAPLSLSPRVAPLFPQPRRQARPTKDPRTRATTGWEALSDFVLHGGGRHRTSDSSSLR